MKKITLVLFVLIALSSASLFAKSKPVPSWCQGGWPVGVVNNDSECERRCSSKGGMKCVYRPEAYEGDDRQFCVCEHQ